jgi:hypothetical protein
MRPRYRSRGCSSTENGGANETRKQVKKTARENGVPKQQGITARSDAGIEHDRDSDGDTGTQLREAVRETEPLGVFDTRAVRDLYKAAPTP